jgi:hypothetical protein
VPDQVVEQRGQAAGADERQHARRGQRREAGQGAAEVLGVVAGEVHGAGAGGADRAQQEPGDHLVAEPPVAVHQHVPAVQQRHQGGDLTLVRQQQPAHPQLRRRVTGRARRRLPAVPRVTGGAGRGRLPGRRGRPGQRGQVVVGPVVDLPQPVVPGHRQLDLLAFGRRGDPVAAFSGGDVPPLGRVQRGVGRAQRLRQQGPHLEDLLRPGVRHRGSGAAVPAPTGPGWPARGPGGRAARR